MKKLIYPLVIFAVSATLANAQTGATGAKKEAVTTFPEKAAEFPGGTDAMMAYIDGHIKYPAQALRDKTEGKVIVDCTIEADGSVTDAKVVKGIGSGCDEEALRVVNSMPEWKPAQNYGAAVKSSRKIMVRFMLPE